VNESVAQRYVRLGLRLGRHDDGVVDAYFGPPELAAAVEAEPPVAPPALVDDADALLAELDDGWLRDQVLGLRTFAGVLAGEERAYSDEVEGCYGIRPSHTDEAVFAEAHERLDELLPGEGTLLERHDRWERSSLLPPDRIEATIAAVIAEARAQTARDVIDLPDGEGTELELVHDVPWLGYNFYMGQLRGRIAVNADMPMSPTELLILALHETYPGHQAERACKERLLVRDRGLVEETLVLAPTPQSLVTEGIGTIAPWVLLDGPGADALAAPVRDAGVTFDLAHAMQVRLAAQPCRRAEVNAALMLHEDGASEADVHAYLRRWAMVTPEIATHLIRYITNPASRTYITNYPVGYELCSRFAAHAPDGLRRLLTEQVRVSDLLAIAA
jgi:hypothetical protein